MDIVPVGVLPSVLAANPPVVATIVYCILVAGVGVTPEKVGVCVGVVDGVGVGVADVLGVLVGYGVLV
jgi:hypothetical protein